MYSAPAMLLTMSPDSTNVDTEEGAETGTHLRQRQGS